MIANAYSLKYLKTYLWQGVAFISRFLSIFIVTPYLAKEPAIYGIYAVCISVTVFLNYADLGFLRAGQKYAAECFARGERAEEMKYVGFGAFVLLVFTLICVSVFFYLGVHPQFLIRGLDTPEKILTASRLLLILAVFTPLTVLQRMVLMIFEIRLDSYVFQRISICASIIIIGSVFYFFKRGSYQIVPYFFFSQAVNAIATMACLWLAKRKYSYNIKQLLRSVRFDAVVYKRVGKLAYSGLYGMAAWIIFYELDQVVIGKFLGAEKVAIYAAAFTIAILFRTVCSILFSPFAVRANHFAGNGDNQGLKRLCLQLFTLSAPLVIIPTVAFVLVAKPFILSWVGVNYIDSVDLARLFALIFTFSFISYTASIFLIAKERVKEINIIAIVQPVIYWLGVITTYSFLGLLSFGSFKFIATLVSEAYYFFILIRFFKIPLKKLLQKTFYPVIRPLIFLVTALIIADRYLPYEKSKINLLIVLGTTGICIVVSLAIQYIVSSDIRLIAKNILKSVFSNA